MNFRIIPSTKEEREVVRSRQRSKFAKTKTCAWCGEEFDYGYSSLHVCGACHIIVECCVCGDEFELDLDAFSGTDQSKIKQAIANKKELALFCSKECRAKHGAESLKEWHKNNPNASRESTLKSYNNQFCDVCGTETLHRGDCCCTCNAQAGVKAMQQYYLDHPEKRKRLMDNALDYWRNNPEEWSRKAKENLEKINNRFLKFCDVCGKETPHNVYGCLVCNPVGMKPNFQTFDNVKFYKGEPVEVVANEILNGKREIKDYPGFNVRFGKVFYRAENILTGDIHLLKGTNFTIHNNVEYVLDKRTGQYVEKEQYFNEFKDKISKMKVVEEVQKFLNLGFTIEPIIGYDPNNEMWSREQTDRYLVEHDYGWIVYVKLFKGLPFIVGKTSTRKVADSPFDFDFQVGDESNVKYNGIGRRFIRERYPEIKFTDYDKVLIYNCNNEEDAYKLENYIARKFDLFEN